MEESQGTGNWSHAVHVSLRHSVHVSLRQISSQIQQFHSPVPTVPVPVPWYPAVVPWYPAVVPRYPAVVQWLFQFLPVLDYSSSCQFLIIPDIPLFLIGEGYQKVWERISGSVGMISGSEEYPVRNDPCKISLKKPHWKVQFLLFPSNILLFLHSCKAFLRFFQFGQNVHCV